MEVAITNPGTARVAGRQIVEQQIEPEPPISHKKIQFLVACKVRTELAT